ncbi:conserved hypothetical protein [Uncinocarpus reesii 1704]|uniref:Uncharacterized protein n=1 Tax=Uncinocarpus reesii (strain UAMH 1704) TaxID=336963 RepID=C4JFC4_UNCRE|nr:uncharacterized protein UREG_02346 [Uncinocarpus reesii 1704]EEP77497.1 conserved hypothetical protein [Uncinocarpus reesii 1704]
MDIHRCRFVPYNPQAINALAFSHPPSADLSGRGVPTLRLAIGRANGDIELWNPLRGTWCQETILRGGKDRSIEGLVWTLDPSEKDSEGNDVPGKLRLFSIGYSSVVTEWDLEQGRPARHSSGNYGEIWCLAAQPRWKSSRRGEDGRPMPPAEGEFAGQHLAVGCADGAIVLLSTSDGDLKYLRTMRPSTKKSRVLNITFQNRDTIVAAYADSSIRIFDIRNGKLLRTVTLGKGQHKAAKELLVWTVKCLPDGTIVSGDSAGEIRFWDPKNYSLVQRIHSHQADILDIAVSADGESVITVGADQRTTIYKPKAPERGAKSRRWVEVMHRRYHTHDVKAIAVYETKEISVMVSGGLDTVPVIVPLRSHEEELHRKLPSLPQRPQVSSSPSSRLLMSWWDREVNIWRVSSPTLPEPLEPQQHKLVAKVLFQGEENLTSAALSSNGKFLVAASISEVKAFALSPKVNGDKTILQVNKLEIPVEISKHGAREVAISPDCQWLCLIRPDNTVCMAKIDSDPEVPGRARILPRLRKLRRVQRHLPRGKRHHGSLGTYDRTIRCVAFSADSRILACGDIAGFVDSWVLQDETVLLTNGTSDDKTFQPESSDDDSSDEEGDSSESDGQRWVVPRFDSPIPQCKPGILLMTFRPPSQSQPTPLMNGDKSNSTSHISEGRLIVLTTEHQPLEFNVIQGKLTDWARRNPKTYLPKAFTIIKDRAMGAFWDPNGSNERLWLYGPSWLWMFDLSQDFPTPEDLEAEKKSNAVSKIDSAKDASRSKKRKRPDAGEDKIKQPNSGAGDRIPLWHDSIGFGRKMRKVIGSDGKAAQATLSNLNHHVNQHQNDEEDVDLHLEPSRSLLADLRREQAPSSQNADLDDRSDLEKNEAKEKQKQSQPPSLSSSPVKPPSSDLPNGTAPSQVAFAVVIHTQSKTNPNVQKASETNDNASDTESIQPQVQNSPNGAEPSLESKTKRRQNARRWWHTFKYRDIFGIVPLSQGFTSEKMNGDSIGKGLEVAVVERPMWDVPLPGRYVRDYE